jgi:tetratricopeptide (TPR) repeat protein
MNLGSVVQNKFGDQFFSGINESSFATESAQTLFEQFLFPKLVQKDSLYIIIGTDSGLLVNAVEHHFAQSHANRQIVFIEYADVLSCFSDVKHPNWLTIIPSDIEKIESVLTNDQLEYVLQGRVVFIDSMAVLDNNVDYLALKRKVISFSSELDDFKFMAKSNAIFLATDLMNTVYNQQPLGDYKQYFLGATALIIGAGPSLDRLIPWIREHAKDVIIFAAARVAKRLIQEGIRADFYVSIDPKLDSFFNSRDVLREAHHSCLITSTFVNPTLLSQWQGNKLYVGSHYPWAKQLDVDFGNTVSHAAIHVAIQLGFNRVLMAGVDLCFIDHKTHEAAGDERAIGKYFVPVRSRVTTYLGGLAETKPEFEEGRLRLQEMVARYQQADSQVSFYNLSAHAARVEGITLWDFSQPVNQVLPDFRARYETLMAKLALTPRSKEKHCVMVLTDMRKIRKETSVLQTILHDGIRLLSNDKNHLDTKFFDKVYKVDKKLTNDLPFPFELVTQMGFLYFIRLSSIEARLESVGMDNLSLSQFSEFYLAKFTAYSQALATILEKIDSALEKVSMRKKLLDGVALKHLQPFWMEHAEPGVVFEWLSLFPQQAVESDNVVRIAELKEAYRYLLEEMQSPINNAYLAQATDISYLLQELDNAIKLKNRDELGSLQGAFEQAVRLTTDTDAVHCVGFLFRGLLANLNQQPVLALDALLQARFELPMLQELVLKERLKSALALNEHMVVVACYEALCQLSNRFYVIFAGYYISQNQFESAQKWLVLHLAEYPNDVSSAIKLVRVYQMLHAFSEAAQLLSRLVETYPEHHELTEFLNALQS